MEAERHSGTIPQHRSAERDQRAEPVATTSVLPTIDSMGATSAVTGHNHCLLLTHTCSPVRAAQTAPLDNADIHATRLRAPLSVALDHLGCRFARMESGARPTGTTA